MSTSRVVPSLDEHGFVVIPQVLASTEVADVLNVVRATSSDMPGVMRDRDVYAVRHALNVFPLLPKALMLPALLNMVHLHFVKKAFITKSIWFEKPPGGNWFVGWHQDISISVAQRIDVPGYSRWTAKHGVVGVVPPLAILQRTLTMRIHLDDADGENGAVRVIPGSHRAGILPPPAPGTEGVLCAVPAGGVMLMRPLLMHASSRSRTERPRRVLHLELNDLELEGGLEWAERRTIPALNSWNLRFTR